MKSRIFSLRLLRGRCGLTSAVSKHLFPGSQRRAPFCARCPRWRLPGVWSTRLPGDPPRPARGRRRPRQDACSGFKTGSSLWPRTGEARPRLSAFCPAFCARIQSSQGPTGQAGVCGRGGVMMECVLGHGAVLIPPWPKAPFFTCSCHVPTPSSHQDRACGLRMHPGARGAARGRVSPTVSAWGLLMPPAQG